MNLETKPLTRLKKWCLLLASSLAFIVAVGSNLSEITGWVKNFLPAERQIPEQLEIYGQKIYFAGGRGTTYEDAVKVAKPQFHDLSILAEYKWLEEVFPDFKLSERYLIEETLSFEISHNDKGMVVYTKIPITDQSSTDDEKHQVSLKHYDVYRLVKKREEVYVYFDVSELFGLPDYLMDQKEKMGQFEKIKEALENQPGRWIEVPKSFVLGANRKLINATSYQ